MSTSVILTLFALILSESIALDCSGTPKQREGELRQFLFCDYDRLLPPVRDYRNPLIIKDFKINLRSFEFEEHEGTLRLYTWLTMNWRDDHSSWSPRNWDNIDRIYVTSDEVWIPDVYLDQSEKGDLVTRVSNIDCSIRSNGTVLCIIPITLNVLCVGNYSNWPYDTQKCRMNFLTWSYLAEQVDFDNDSLRFETTDVHESMTWKILKAEVVGRWSQYWDEGATNVGIEFDITLKRFSTELGYVPPIFVSILNFVTMLMRLQSKQRLILASVTITMQFILTSPHVWSGAYHTDSMPLVFLYYQYSYLITMLIIIETVVLSAIKRIEVSLPQWANFSLEQLWSNRIIHTLLADFNWTHPFTKNDRIDKPEDSWTIFLKIIDRLLMITMIVAYCLMFQLLLPTMDSYENKIIPSGSAMEPLLIP